MKKLKLLFNVSEAALTAAVFVLVTALVPMDIILKLVSQSVINGNPCLYDALISVNVSTMWRYVEQCNSYKKKECKKCVD